MYTELDHINATLAALGELPVNSVDAPHPEVPAIRADLRNKSVHLQGEGWWFNIEYPTLQPQVNGTILLPNNTLSVDTLTNTPNIAARGGKLYNLTDSTDKFTQEVKVRLVRFLAFEELPLSARFYVSASALAETQASLDADGAKARRAKENEGRAYNLFHAEHIRYAQVNLMERSTFAYRIREVIGDSPFSQRYIR